MPNPAAQQYFNSFDPATQAQIQASWAGNPNGMDDWFNAAQQAGAVNQQGTRKGGGGDQGAGVNTGSGQGGMNPQKLRQHAKQQGWSEDFDRFSDELLQGWITRSWDPSKGKFRSEHAPQGATGDWAYVEKPTEGIVDPQGTEWGPHGNKVGVNLSSLGLNTLKGSVGSGGRGHVGGGGQPAAAAQPQAPQLWTDNPLQNQLIQMAQSGAFGANLGGGVNNAASLQGGGVWSGAGADFSQKFNPLAPQGKKKGGGGGGGGQQNPFQAAMMQPAGGGEVQKSPFQSAMSPMLAGQNGSQFQPTQASPMQNKLYKLYGGNNTFQGRM